MQLSWTKSVLVRCKILGLFVNTMTADGKHSLLNRDNLMQPIQMQLCKKQKPFFQFFSPLMKSGFNFEDFQTNMTLIAYVFWKLPTAKDVVRQMSKKSYLERPFHKQHGK